MKFCDCIDPIIEDDIYRKEWITRCIKCKKEQNMKIISNVFEIKLDAGSKSVIEELKRLGSDGKTPQELDSRIPRLGDAEK